MPASGTDALSTERYYNQAFVKIIVDSSGNYKYYNKNGTQCTSSGSNALNKQIYNTFNAALAKNESFTDTREGSTVTVSTMDINKITTDVNAGKLTGTDDVTGSTTSFNGVIYFSDQRASQTGGTPKDALRLKNGSALPTYTTDSTVPGLTVATDNPVYIVEHDRERGHRCRGRAERGRLLQRRRRKPRSFVGELDR